MTEPAQPSTAAPAGPVVLAATQRCGSYLFADLLGRYGGVPFPEEYLIENLLPARRALALPLELPPGEVLRRLMAEAGRTHGRFAIKVMWGVFVRFFFKLSETRYGNTSFVNRTIRETWPDARYLFVRRRDKIAQAVSFSRARQTGVWRTTAETEAAAPAVLEYAYRDIHWCWTRIQEDERAWLDYFEKNRIPYHEVWYEDLLRRRQATLDAALAFAGLTPRGDAPPEPVYRRVSDGLNAEWAERFTARLQAAASAGDGPAPIDCAGLEVTCAEPALDIPVGEARRVVFGVTNRGAASVTPRPDEHGFLAPLLRLRESGAGQRVLAEVELETPLAPGESVQVHARLAAEPPARGAACVARMEDDQGGAGPERTLGVRFAYDARQAWIARVFGAFRPSPYEGWVWVPALGALHVARFPWLYHCEHGWWRADPDASAPGVLAAWDAALGRMRLALPTYPVMECLESGRVERLRFQGTDAGRRRFSDAAGLRPARTVAMSGDPGSEEPPPPPEAPAVAPGISTGETPGMATHEPLPAPPLVIAATHRCGSYLFCDLLARYGGLPFPEEYFNENLLSARRLLALPAGMPAAEVLQRLRTHAEQRHGRFALKAMWPAFATIMFRIAREQHGNPAFVHKIMEDSFSNAKYIFVRRRNKIGQAVSYHRALLTGVWRSAVNEAESRPEPGALHYSYRAIHECWTRIQEDEAAWLEHFKTHGIAWHEVWYEDLVKQRKDTLDAALAFLDVPPRSAEPPDPGFRRVSDDTNRDWGRRFEATLQQRRAESAAGVEPGLPAGVTVVCAEPELRAPVFGAGGAVFRLTNPGPAPLLPGATPEGRAALVLRLRAPPEPDAAEGRVLAEEDLEEPVPPGGTAEIALRLCGTPPERALEGVVQLERATGAVLAAAPLRVRFAYDDAQRAVAGIFGGFSESHWKGWVQVPVLGTLSLRRFPWIYQCEHGWLKVMPDASGPGVLVAGDAALGPLRIPIDEYPEMIRLRDRTRMRFHGTKDGVRTFSDAATPGERWTAPMNQTEEP